MLGPRRQAVTRVRFWRGLSGYHESYVSKEKRGDVEGVMEVLDTVNDEKMGEDSEEESESLRSWESSLPPFCTSSLPPSFQAEAENAKRGTHCPVTGLK